MLSSKEIAKYSLTRAREIKAGKRHRRNIIYSLVGVGLTVSLSFGVTKMTSTDKIPAEDILAFELTADEIPLSAFHGLDQNINLHAEAGKENGPAFLIPVYTEINIPANARDVELSLTNPESNDCFLVFEIVLESGETLFESEPVAPSAFIEDASLSRPLKEGSYSALLIIHAYDKTISTRIKTISAEITIIADH